MSEKIKRDKLLKESANDLFVNVYLLIFLALQFSSGYQPTVGVDYGFKIQHCDGIDCKFLFFVVYFFFH